MRTTVLCLFCLSTLVIAVQAQKLENLDQQAVLSLPLFLADIVSNHLPFTQALGVVVSYVQNRYVLFAKDGQEPIVNVNLPPKSHVDDGLRQIMGQLPGYDYEVISEHMINIYPVGAKNDPKDLLNTPVPKFEGVDVDPGGVLTAPADFIPELAARLRPKTSAGPQPSGHGGSVFRSNVPPITLHLKNTTVRQILNAASEATEQFPPNHQPVGWTYLFQPDSTSPTGGKHSWAFLFSAPRNWKQDAAKSGQYRPTHGILAAYFGRLQVGTTLIGPA